MRQLRCRWQTVPDWRRRTSWAVGTIISVMGDFVFDPRVFILPPFRTCPSCGQEESYGVLTIGGTSYRRRCRACWHSEPYELPEVRKTVMYLDQMAISNMTKILQRREIDPFWLELFV